MKIWLINYDSGRTPLNILDMLDELDCDVEIMYEISNHTPQWLSCSDEAYTRIILMYPELVVIAFDKDSFEAAADEAFSEQYNIPGEWHLNKYSYLALRYV